MLHGDVGMVIDDAHFAKISLLNICRNMRWLVDGEKNASKFRTAFDHFFTLSLLSRVGNAKFICPSVAAHDNGVFAVFYERYKIFYFLKKLLLTRWMELSILVRLIRICSAL